MAPYWKSVEARVKSIEIPSWFLYIWTLWCWTNHFSLLSVGFLVYKLGIIKVTCLLSSRGFLQGWVGSETQITVKDSIHTSVIWFPTISVLTAGLWEGRQDIFLVSRTREQRIPLTLTPESAVLKCMQRIIELHIKSHLIYICNSTFLKGKANTWHSLNKYSQRSVILENGKSMTAGSLRKSFAVPLKVSHMGIRISHLRA